MGEEMRENLFTVRASSKYTDHQACEEPIFLVDLEENEELENADEKRNPNIVLGGEHLEERRQLSSSSSNKIHWTNDHILKDHSVGCSLPCNIPEKDTFSNDVANSDQSKIESNSDHLNQSFSICEKCLSNRKNEFAGNSFVHTKEEPLSDSLNTSKEICICSKHKTCNEDDCISFSADNDIPVREPNNSANCYITNVPDEIMLKIFSYFTLTDLCRFVAPVCISWLQYARDSTLWEVISEEEFKDVPTDLLVKVVTSWCSLLRSIDFKFRTDMTISDFLLIFKTCPFIEKVSFAFCSQLTDDVLKQCSHYLQNLHHINLEGCQISDASIIHLFGKPIHGLNVSHCNMVTDEGLIFLSRNFRNLTHVNLDGIQWISHASVEVLVGIHGETLQEIVLDGADFTDDTIRLLSRCQNTRKLSLSFCDTLTDDSLQWLLQLRKLDYLQLKKGVNFSTFGMLHLLQSFNTLEGKGLSFLNLAECSSLSDECLRAISESCPNLRILNLSWCWEVTDDGINFIFDSCHDIIELHLCGLHELYGIPFRRTQSEMPKLKYLDLRQCNKTSDDLLADLANQIRTLTVLNYYGDTVKANLNYWNLESKCSPDHYHHTSFAT